MSDTELRFTFREWEILAAALYDQAEFWALTAPEYAGELRAMRAKLLAGPPTLGIEAVS